MVNALVETMRIYNARVPLWPWHEARLRHSAQALGYALPLERIRSEVERIVARTPGEATLRLLVRPSGETVLAAQPLPQTPQPYRLGISPIEIVPTDASLYHKTTARSVYDAAQRWAHAHGYDDALLRSPAGTLTEASIANLLARVGGQWWTPPVAEGLLPGVMRRVLIEAGLVRERPLPAEVLRAASHVCLCNAVRGVWPAVLA